MKPNYYEKLTAEAVHRNIERFAKHNGMTVNQLLKKAGVSRVSGWRWKKNMTKPEFATFLQIKEAVL